MGAVQGTHVSVTIDNTAAARITADARTRVIHILAETGMILCFESTHCGSNNTIGHVGAFAYPFGHL